MLRIVLKKSYIGIPDKQRRVLEALGLRKIGGSVVKKNDKSTLGLINKVSHLVSVEKSDL